jgi:DNA-binding MarR family transcriptional regulator
MDDDIARLYAERGLSGVRPRFAYPLIRLSHTGPLTIKDLAASLGLTHSAVSQTVAALRAEGLARTVQGADARTRLVELTPRGRDLVPFLEAEWRATEQAAAELDTALPVPLARFADGVREQLAQRSFLERIGDHLPLDAGAP